MEHYVNIMLDSGFKAALYDEREVMQFLLYLPYDLPSRREGPGVEIRPAPGIWNLPFVQLSSKLMECSTTIDGFSPEPRALMFKWTVSIIKIKRMIFLMAVNSKRYM